jgi:hypothetical protein
MIPKKLQGEGGGYQSVISFPKRKMSAGINKRDKNNHLRFAQDPESIQIMTRLASSMAK